MTEEHEYILGTHAAELERLGFQHHVWVQHMLAVLDLANIRAGDVVLDVGCGPGFTTFELSHAVGPQGRVIALDVSERFLENLRAACRLRALTNVEPLLGTAEEFELPEGSLDAAYSRWVFCWLQRPEDALRRVARTLRPGGVVVIQDYVDWGAKKLVPRSAEHDAVIAACLESWRRGGGRIDIGEHLPGWAEQCGLRVEHFQPIARSGMGGSLVWRWLETFYRGYLPRLIEQQLLTQSAADVFLATWESRADDGTSRVITPTMVDIVLRKE